MTRNRKIVFIGLSVTLSLTLTLAGLLVLDLYVHGRPGAYGGTNVWGYRGPVVGAKEQGERRVAVVGGSTAFGYGTGPEGNFPALLEEMLNQHAAPTDSKVSVVNLAWTGEGAYAFKSTLQDYEYLDYDAVLFYSGYNDLDRENTFVSRYNSPVYRLTGYLPLLPLMMQEKAMGLRYSGDLNAAYGGEKTVFRPNLVDRATATALEAATNVGTSLERQLAQITPESELDGNRLSHHADLGREALSCGYWRGYCGAMVLAVKLVLDGGKSALVVTQPYRTARHREQQSRLVALLRQRFRGESRLHFANLGPTLNLMDPEVSGDTMHLSPAGNRHVAQYLVEPARALVQ